MVSRGFCLGQRDTPEQWLLAQLSTNPEKSSFGFKHKVEWGVEKDCNSFTQKLVTKYMFLSPNKYFLSTHYVLDTDVGGPSE